MCDFYLPRNRNYVTAAPIILVVFAQHHTRQIQKTSLSSVFRRLVLMLAHIFIYDLDSLITWLICMKNAISRFLLNFFGNLHWNCNFKANTGRKIRSSFEIEFSGHFCCGLSWDSVCIYWFLSLKMFLRSSRNSIKLGTHGWTMCKSLELYGIFFTLNNENNKSKTHVQNTLLVLQCKQYYLLDCRW